MFKKATLGLFLLAFNLALADNAPTLHEVYQATQAGRLEEARSMMNKVLKEHPNSGKAHYVEAEILAKQGELG
jgi:Tfp pilus assembly protein PilF